MENLISDLQGLEESILNKNSELALFYIELINKQYTKSKYKLDFIKHRILVTRCKSVDVNIDCIYNNLIKVLKIENVSHIEYQWELLKISLNTLKISFDDLFKRIRELGSQNEELK